MGIQKKAGSTIIHLEFRRAGIHHYFGSIAAIFDTFDPDTIGVSKRRLWDFNITEDRPYKNKSVIVRKGAMRRKPGNRKNPSYV